MAESMRGRPGRWIVPILILAAVAPLIGLLTAPGRRALGDAPASFQDLEESLTCQCGCGLTVHSCNHLQCGSALPLREEIRAQMSAGKSKEAILAYFSDKYGEKILSSPTTSGFNIIAWITPFVLIGLGGLFLAGVLMRWSGGRRPAAADEAAPAAAAHPVPPASPYDKILERELKDFEA